MNFDKILKKATPDLIVVVVFLVMSMAYFFTPMSEGLVLGGHDAVAAVGQGQEQLQYVLHTMVKLRDGPMPCLVVCPLTKWHLRIAQPTR